jgi:hypothetical protein
MKKTIASAAVALLIGGSLAIASVLPAAATEEVCVPAEAWTEIVPDIEHPAVGEPTIVVDNPDYVPAVADSIIKWNWTGGPVEETPTAPPGEGWHEVGVTEDTKGSAVDVVHQGEGKASYFYFQFVAGTPAVGEPTITVENPDYVAAYTEVVADIEHPAVTCEEEPVEVAPVVCVPSGIWYTEGDDNEPVQVEDGLAFYSAGDGKAVGYRQVVGGNLQGWDSVSFAANGDLSQFFFRITVDLSADGGPAYKSLSIPGTTTITQASEVYQFPGLAIADVAALYPNNVITSIGFQTNSGAPEGVGATLTSLSGSCGSVSFAQDVEPEPEPEPEPQPEPQPEEPAVVTPVPTATATPAVVATSDAATLASTGGPNALPWALGGLALALAGVSAWAWSRVRAARQ